MNAKIILVIQTSIYLHKRTFFFQEVEVIYKIFHSGTSKSGHVIKYIHQHNSIFVPETVSTNVEMGPLVALFLHRIKRDITSVG